MGDNETSEIDEIERQMIRGNHASKALHFSFVSLVSLLENPADSIVYVMKIMLFALLALAGCGLAADSGEALAEPQTLVKIATAIEKSGFDELTSKKDEQGTSYHMRRLEFLGTVTRDGRVFSIAHAVFVRSSPPGRETPPARGHDFIVVLNDEFKIVGVGRTGFGRYHMKGEKLYFDENENPCADFGSTEPATRHGGYSDIGLGYPFPDRISDEEWNAGSFLPKP